MSHSVLAQPQPTPCGAAIVAPLRQPPVLMLS